MLVPGSDELQIVHGGREFMCAVLAERIKQPACSCISKHQVTALPEALCASATAQLLHSFMSDKDASPSSLVTRGVQYDSCKVSSNALPAGLTHVHPFNMLMQCTV